MIKWTSHAVMFSIPADGDKRWLSLERPRGWRWWLRFQVCRFLGHRWRAVVTQHARRCERCYAMQGKLVQLLRESIEDAQGAMLKQLADIFYGPADEQGQGAGTGGAASG